MHDSSLYRLFSTFTGAFAVAFAGAVLAAPSFAQRSPNVVFVFSDDHAYQAIGAYGSKLAPTPSLDRLAREGVLFENSFVTNSICCPSRAVVLSGRHSHLNGVLTNAHTFDGSQVTFPKLLRGAGYQTAIVGKWHLKSDPTGFDHWEVLRGQGPYYNPLLLREGGKKKWTGYTTDIITDRALHWVDNERKADQPFFLCVWHKAPHRHWQPAPRHLALFDEVQIPEPPTLFDDWSGRASPAFVQEMSISDHLFPNDLKLIPQRGLTPEQTKLWDAAYGPKNARYAAAGLEGAERVRWMYQRYLKDYLRCITAVDENIGRLRAELEKRGLMENTIFVYSSDQGFYLGEHGWYDKRWMYEESLRTPLIVRMPGGRHGGRRLPELVQNLDLAPTFCAIAGIEPHAEMQGRSLKPLLESQKPAKPWRESIYYQYCEFPGAHMVHRHYGVRTDRYKLIHYYQTGEWELFDLVEDPSELRSVHDEPAYTEIRKRLQVELQRLREQYRVPKDKAPLPQRRRRQRL